MQEIDVLAERKVQDYRSVYNDIRDWFRREREGKAPEESKIDWDEFEHNKRTKDKSVLVEEIRRVIRTSIGNRAKEGLIVDFINKTDLDPIKSKADIMAAFFAYAQEKQKEEAFALIEEENLNVEAAKRYIQTSLKRKYASENGTDLYSVLPKMSPLNPLYRTKKQHVLQKISAFVEKFRDIGGQL